MDDLKLPQDKDKKPEVSFTRKAVWFILGAIAVYMIISGLIGGLAK